MNIFREQTCPDDTQTTPWHQLPYKPQDAPTPTTSNGTQSLYRQSQTAPISTTVYKSTSTGTTRPYEQQFPHSQSQRAPLLSTTVSQSTYTGTTRPTNTHDSNNHTRRELSVPQVKNILQKKLDNRPWKIIFQNANGLLTEKSNIGLKTIEEYTNNEKILMVNITETWYNETIKEDADIDGYNIYRCDRK